MIEDARREQQELIARAARDIDAERERAVESLRREAVEIAIAAASRLVGQKVNAAEDRKLVAEYLKAVPSDGRGAGAA